MHIKKCNIEHFIGFWLVTIGCITCQVNLQIKKIELIGLKSVPDKEIIYNMKLKEGQQFDEQIFLEDIKRLYGLGYFSKIDYEKEITKDGVNLKIIFYENPVVRSITIKYSKHFSSKKIKTLLTISEGELLNENKIQQTQKNILEQYRKDGYVFATVDYDIKVTAKQANITFTIVEGKRVKVKEIEFLGIKDIKPKKIKKVMKTKESSFLFSKYLNEKILKEDMIRINSFMRSLGFLDANSYIYEMNFSPLKDKVKIVIFIEPGEKYTISDIMFEGFTLFTKEQLLKTIKSKKGDVFSIKKIEENDIFRLKELYGNAGYPEINIQYFHKLTDKPKELILVFKTEETSKAQIRKINISGNIKTKDKVIRRELLIFPGDIYNYSKIKESLQRLYSLRYFEDVKIEHSPTPKHELVDLNVKVKEARTGFIRFGAGFSSVSGLLGIVELGQDNFDIGRFPKSFDDLVEGTAFAGGGQTFKLFFAPGTRITQMQLFFREPYLFDKPLSFFFSVQNIFADYRFYKEKDFSISSGLERRFESKWFVGTKIEYELLKVTDIVGTAPQIVKDVAGSNSFVTITPYIGKSTIDNYSFPTGGVDFKLNNEIALKGLGSDFSYFKPIASLKFYKTVYTTNTEGKHILALKTNIGAITSLESSRIPFFKKFFAGGPGTVRGFKYRTISPKIGGDEIGGKYLFTLQTEYSLPIYRMEKQDIYLDVIRVFAFYDVGTADDKFFKNLRHSTGIGVRFSIPGLVILPLFEIDFGIPIKKGADDDTQFIQFAVGNF